MNRGRVYGLLSRCYEVEMDDDFAKQFAEQLVFASDKKELVTYLEAMKEDLADYSEEHFEHLAVVFNRIFFGMGPQTAQKAFPYESVYTSEKGLMMQEAYLEAVSAYREERLVKNPSFPEPEDHIAVELAFMQSLCDRTRVALEEENMEKAEQLFSQQHEFLVSHLLNWIEPFTADMEASAEEGFYRHLACFTEKFLKADEEALSEVVG